MGSGSGKSARRLVLGIDIGGTFTDFFGAAEGQPEPFVHKRLTTHDDPTEAIFKAIDVFEDRYAITPGDSLTVVHATTLATNLILEGKGARAALITTRGFRDILTMRRENRYDDYDFDLVYPEPLIPRSLRYEVAERTLACGDIAAAPSEAEVREIAARARADGAESIAVCLLHAYVNPRNEQRVHDLLRACGCEVPISLSSRVQPEIREYERCSTTAVNAYVQPAVLQYIQRFEARLSAKPYRTGLFIMQSNGGYADGRISGELPARLIESGPAAGAIAAGHISAQTGRRRAIAFDMGGTTAKITTLQDFVPEISPELEVARVHRLKKGSGIPLRCPSVELIEIGSGGGSIAHLDPSGGLRVGPESAGSSPGPACYGRGGELPTVTDADLVLGYLDPDAFPFRLDRRKAEAAIRLHVADPLGIDVDAAAAGIVELVTEQMSAATRIQLVEKGLDPREFTLVAFGGAGPVHACFVARRLGIRSIVYPLAAGVASALGLLVAPNTSAATRTFIQQLESADWNALRRVIAELKDEADRQMLQDDAHASPIEYKLLLDMRYARQGYDILVEIDGPLGADLDAARIERCFSDKYAKTFGRLVEGVKIEIVGVRLFARARPFGSVPPHAARPDVPAAGGAPARRRRLYLKQSGGLADCQVLTRAAVRALGAVQGPLVIEDPETTIVIDADASVSVDEHGHVIAELK